MGEIAFSAKCQNCIVLNKSMMMKKKKKKQEWQCHALTGKRSQPLIKIQAATYSSTISTDIPLSESPGVPLLSFFLDFSL